MPFFTSKSFTISARNIPSDGGSPEGGRKGEASPLCFRCRLCLPYCPALYLYVFQSMLWGRFLFDVISVSFRLLTSFTPLALLHVQWASCKLPRSDGCPPLSIGMMWSMQGLIGSGYFNVLSTGFPHIPQMLCVANIFFFADSNALLCVPSWSGLSLFIFLQNKRATLSRGSQGELFYEGHHAYSFPFSTLRGNARWFREGKSKSLCYYYISL